MPEARFAIWIVDNSDSNVLSLDDFSALKPDLETMACELSLIQGQGNVGYGSGHNLAMDKTSSGFHLIMNPDVELGPECLILGIQYLCDNPDVAAVSPAVTGAAGEKQFLCKRYPSVFDFFLRGFMPAAVRRRFAQRLAQYEMHDLEENRPSKDIPIISGCFMLCRTQFLKQAAGFNEDYFLYFEDFDLSMRLNELGGLAYLPAMKIVHLGGNSARKGLVHIRMFVRSGIRFFRTYGWRIF